MSREILFRGKSIHKDGWVEGLPMYNSNCQSIDKIEVAMESGGIGVRIIPESVGQFTGLLDNNGNKIFEGDILTSSFGEGLPFQILFGQIDIEINEDGKSNFVCFYIKEKDENICEFGNSVEGNTNCYKIIGNIHDNPELIGK